MNLIKETKDKDRVLFFNLQLSLASRTAGRDVSVVTISIHHLQREDLLAARRHDENICRGIQHIEHSQGSRDSDRCAVGYSDLVKSLRVLGLDS